MATSTTPGPGAPEATGGELDEQMAPTQLAVALRRHVGAIRYEHASLPPAAVVYELMQMADQLDGGVGAAVHRGCPDPSIPTANCYECALVLEDEAPANPSPFRGTNLTPVFDED